MPNNLYFKFSYKIIIFCFMFSKIQFSLCEVDDFVLKQPLISSFSNPLTNIQIPNQSLNVNPNNPDTILTTEGIEINHVGKNIFILMGNGTIHEIISSLINVIPNDNVKVHLSNKTSGNISFVTNNCNLIIPEGGVRNNIIFSTKDFTLPDGVNDKIFLSGYEIGFYTQELIFPQIPVPSNQISVANICVDQNGKVYKVRSLSTASASRYKNNIHPLLKEESKEIYNLNVVSYEYKDCPGVIEYGLIADELDKNNTFKNALRYNENGEVDSIVYTTIMAAAIKEIQELKQDVERLKEEIIYLKNLL